MDQKQLDIIKSKIVDRDDLYIVLNEFASQFGWDYITYSKYADYMIDWFNDRDLIGGKCG